MKRTLKWGFLRRQRKFKDELSLFLCPYAKDIPKTNRHIFSSALIYSMFQRLECTFHDAGMYVPRCWNIEFLPTNAGNYRNICRKYQGDGFLMQGG